MMNIIDYLKNMALVIGTNKADDAVDGSIITKQVLDQINKFTKDPKKTDQIKSGPLKNFIREMYSGLFNDKDSQRKDLVEWCASLREVQDGGAQKTEEAKRGNQGNFGSVGHK